jgi:hypothetical protein
VSEDQLSDQSPAGAAVITNGENRFFALIRERDALRHGGRPDHLPAGGPRRADGISTSGKCEACARRGALNWTLPFRSIKTRARGRGESKIENH